MASEVRVDLRLDPAAGLRHVAASAEQWGASWRGAIGGGELVLPVVAGVRRGWVRGRVTVEPTPEGSRLVFREEESEYQLQLPIVIILGAAFLVAVLTIVAPLWPPLLPILPLGVVLTLVAWLFILSALRNSGAEEFFATLAEEAPASDEA